MSGCNGPLSFSAVGTIHHKEWIYGGVGFIRIVQMAWSNNQIVRTYGTCRNQCPSWSPDWNPGL